MKLGITGLCLCAALNAATGVAVAQLTSFDDLVSRLLTKWEIKGAALAVSHDGRLILARGYGSTDVDAPVQILRVAVGLDGSRPPGFLKQARPQAMAAPSSEVFDRALVLREATGVDVVLLFDSWPADRAAFEADVSAGVAQVANSIKDWPPVDRFVEGPELFARDVVNAAATTGGQVVPGETILLFPSNAGPTELARLQVDRDGRVSSMIGETRVLFDGIPAPMGYSVSGHICAIVTYEVSGRQTTEVVVEYQGVRSPPVSVPVARSAPALFTLDLSGKGQAAMLNETGCCNSTRNPAMRGSVVALYATGEGQTTPAGVDGKVATSDRTSGLPAPRLPVRVTLGGVPAEITYAGEAPQMIGSLQVNFRVPANAPVGDAVPIVLTVGNYRSPDGVTMAVRSRTPLVLVIDDDAAVRSRLSGIMAGAGYNVLTAQNTREALDQAKDQPIDLVISGLAKPIEERAQAIRTMLTEHPRLRIMATADGLGADALVAADLLGAQAILTKPLAAETVKRRIREILRSRPTPYVAVEETPRFPINGPDGRPGRPPQAEGPPY
jgi:uncharacterized protein (TIGR03437 family)